MRIANHFAAVLNKFLKMVFNIFFEFVTLTSWIFVINLVVEMLSLSFKTRLGFDYRGTLIALPILFSTDLALIILAFKIRKSGKISRKLISSIFSVAFLVKFVILIMLIVVNGHDLTEHWILIPYNSRTIVADIELMANVLTFLFHIVWSMFILKPILHPNACYAFFCRRVNSNRSTTEQN